MTTPEEAAQQHPEGFVAGVVLTVALGRFNQAESRLGELRRTIQRVRDELPGAIEELEKARKAVEACSVKSP